MTFTKLFASITESTIWCEDDPTRIVWITMLAMSNKNGFVFGSVPGLASRARVSLESTERALLKFQEPDKYSRTKDFEGRRIETVDGGWRLLTYTKHRGIRDEEDRREYMRDLMRKKRAKVTVSKKISDVSHSETPLAQAEAEAEADKIKSPPAHEQEIPADLHPLEYARKLLEEITFPVTTTNLKTVAAAIESEITGGKTARAAFSFILAETLGAQEQGVEINKFFFEDGLYRQERRNAKRNGAANSRGPNGTSGNNRRPSGALDPAADRKRYATGADFSDDGDPEV